MKWNGRTRCALVCVFFALLFSVFSYRLIYLQMVKHDYYSQLAAEKNVGRNVIPAERGAIYDANNEVLAQNVPVATVVADGDADQQQRRAHPASRHQRCTFRLTRLRKKSPAAGLTSF